MMLRVVSAVCCTSARFAAGCTAPLTTTRAPAMFILMGAKRWKPSNGGGDAKKQKCGTQ